MTYREPLFQVGTIQHVDNPYEVTTYLSVDADMGKASTPHLTLDSWEERGGRLRTEQVRMWLNKQQWAELAEFAAKMAEDERIPNGDEREDVLYLGQDALAERVAGLQQ